MLISNPAASVQGSHTEFEGGTVDPRGGTRESAKRGATGALSAPVPLWFLGRTVPGRPFRPEGERVAPTAVRPEAPPARLQTTQPWHPGRRRRTCLARVVPLRRSGRARRAPGQEGSAPSGAAHASPPAEAGGTQRVRIVKLLQGRHIAPGPDVPPLRGWASPEPDRTHRFRGGLACSALAGWPGEKWDRGLLGEADPSPCRPARGGAGTPAVRTPRPTCPRCRKSSICRP